jgi:hypothetical protein
MKKFMSVMLISIIMLCNVQASQLDTLVNKAGKSAYNDGKGVLNSLHQDVKSVVGTAHDDALKLSTYLQPRVDSLISKAYKITGDGLHNLWSIFVKQQKVYSYSMLFVYLISFISIIRVFRQLMKINRDNNITEPPGWLNLIYATWGILACVSFIYCSTNIYEIFTGLFNPEYGALKALSEMVQTVK